MKRLINLAILFLLAATVVGQPKKPVGQFGRAIVTDSIKLRGIWYKTLSGQNLATANLTATGNYTHDWTNKQLVINNVGPLLIDVPFQNQLVFSRRNLGNPSLGMLNSFGVSGSITFFQARTNTQTSIIQMGADNTLHVTPKVFYQIGSYTTQPAASLLSLSNPVTGEMAWTTPGAIVNAGGGATAGQYWATGGNSSPTTTNFTLGSLTADDVSFVTGIGGNEVIRLTKTGGVGIRQSSPSSSLDVAGSFGVRLTKISMSDGGTYTIGSAVSDATGALTYVIDFDGSVSDGNIVLPDPANAINRIIIVKRSLVNMGAALFLSSSGAGKVENDAGDFVTNFSIDPNKCYWLQSDGSNWHLIFYR